MEENRILELLTRRKANEATDDELDELNELLKAFPEASQLEDGIDNIWNLKVDDEDAELAYNRHRNRFEQEFELFDHNQYESTAKKILRSKRFIVGALAVLFSIVIAGYVFFKFSDTKKTKAEYFVHVSTGKGTHKTIILPDGTKVWLNSNSQFSYDSIMKSNSSRVANLSGEAFFDIAHDKEHPFIVKSNKFSIKVLGTAFNVKDYPEDEKFETTLLRGSIELSLNENSQRKFKLNPSEKFAITENRVSAHTKYRTEKKDKSNTMSLSIVNVEPVTIDNKEYYPETSWMANKLVFENESLKDLVPVFERWFHTKITVKKEQIKDYKFTGVFVTETIDQALQAMKLIKPFNYKIDKEEVILY